MKTRILAIGDVVGRPGRVLLKERLPEFCRKELVDCVIANGENISGGSGIMPSEADEVFKAGVHVLTAGDHAWGKKEIIPYIDRTPNLLRPANFPAEQPGRGSTVVETAGGVRVGVVTLLGRVFMNVQADCPFHAARRLVSELKAKTPVVAVEIHCEATSEKIAMGWHLDGRVSVLFGTHTHIPTADERVLPKGTAYITDVGMTGPYDSVLGRDKERVVGAMVTSVPAAFEVATDDVRLCGVVVTVEATTGRATQIERIRYDGTPGA